MKFREWFNKKENIDIKDTPKYIVVEKKEIEKVKELVIENVIDPIDEFNSYKCDVTNKLKLSRRGSYEGYFSTPPLEPMSLKILYNNNILIDNGKSELVLEKDNKIKVGRVITAHGYYNISDNKNIGKIPKSGVIAKYNIYDPKK